MQRILHITTHLGGGVGNVSANVALYAKNNEQQYQYKIVLLEEPEKSQFFNLCIMNDVEVIVKPSAEFIAKEMSRADIVLLSWWHHPKMAKFLSEFPKIPIRLILWCHVNGCSYPALPFEFAKMPHKVFFTSKYSFENHYWSKKECDMIVKNSEIIYGVGDLNHFSKAKLKSHQGFNIGYVGTLNYSKINPEYVDFCAKVDIPDSKFIMIGDWDNKSNIEDKAREYGIHNKFEFRGYTNNVVNELEYFDVFAYPLNPWHFGTTENALLEAMAAGLPVVALNQCTEKYLIKHMQTGLLADDKEHYAKLIQYLYENPSERERIGQNAKEFVLSNFSLRKNMEKMNNTYNEIINSPKKIFEFNSVFGVKPYQWFLSCLGSDKEMFQNSINDDITQNDHKMRKLKKEIANCHHIIREKSKSSIYHFSRYFPEDKNISFWISLIN